MALESPALDESDAAIAIRRYRTQLPRFRREFESAVRSFHVEAAAKGIAHSGAFMYGLQRLCQDESTRRINAARDAVKFSLEGGWFTTSSEALQTFRACFEETAENGTYADINAAMRNAVAIAGIALSNSQTEAIVSGIVTVHGATVDEAEAELVAVARKQPSGSSNIFNAPIIGAVQIGDRNKAVIDTSDSELHMLTEDPAHQLQRERDGEPRVPRQHFEVLLDPSLQGVIVRECALARQRPVHHDPAAPDIEDPTGRILLANIGRVAAVRLHLTLPLQILTASPFPDEAKAYKKDQVISHVILVRCLRPGSIIVTVTNRLSSPIVIGFKPEAYVERDVEGVHAEPGRARLRTKVIIQTLFMCRVEAATRRHL